MSLRFVNLAVLVGCLWVVPAFAGGATGSLRAGMEWDDNALRTEGAAAVSDVLARYFSALTLQHPVVERSALVLDIAHGGKFFLNEAEADTLLTQVFLGYQQRFDDHFGLYAQLDVKDRTERISRRDYIRAGGGAGFDVFLGPVALRGGLATRFFAFKPSADASSSNVEAQGRVKWDIDGAFYTAMSYTYARRSFETSRFVLDAGAVTEDPSTERGDDFDVVSMTLGWRGRAVLEASYAYSVNASNSYGQNLRRHSADLTATAPLPWSLFVSTHLELQRTAYEDPVLIDADFLVDEDNRNSVVASVARGFGDAFELELRYSLYLQEFGVGSDYRRQTLMLAAGYLF